MIKQFNFYDIYGYLLPGLVLLALVWLPVGVISKDWPDQDLSKAIFITLLAYVLGHILQTIATKALPSKVMVDESGRRRFPSDRLLDKGCPALSMDFKARLAEQVHGKFGLRLHVDDDGDGTGAVCSDRENAFFLARSYLIAKKTGSYVEQFQGLYAMMRGLVSALVAGACYLAGWALAFHHNSACLRAVMEVLGVLALTASLVSAIMAIRADDKADNECLSRVLLILTAIGFAATGFWLGVWQPSSFWSGASCTAEWPLWLAFSLSLIAAARCFSLYRTFAIKFARSAWQDFSVYLILEEQSATALHAADNEAS